MSYFYFISVVIPTFNRRDYLACAIESVMRKASLLWSALLLMMAQRMVRPNGCMILILRLFAWTQLQQGVSVRNHGID